MFCFNGETEGGSMVVLTINVYSASGTYVMKVSSTSSTIIGNIVLMILTEERVFLLTQQQI